MTHRIVGRGTSPALGATPDGDGVSFGLFSAHATRVELCLFSPDGAREAERIALPARTGDVWHGHVAGLRAGQLYGYRVHGPYEPLAGHRFNPNKLLVDPYAKRLSGGVLWNEAICGYGDGGAETDLGFDARDSAPFVPKGAVVAASSPTEHARPRRPWSETLIYESHVRGLTMRHSEVPEPIRGTYAALGHPAIIAHLRRIGVTALELLPIQFIADERALLERGLVNYWGYSTLNFFTPDPRYGNADDLKQAIRTLHEAGIEVILDAVYNHTAETDELGPTLSFRGIDNLSYYKHRPEELRRPWNVTGCGNTFDLSRAPARDLVLASLRYWADEYGVDGFRFDLAPALAREPYDFAADAAFLQAVAADPVLSGLKLIAEPWDAAPGGYQLGRFPPGWSEWNDRFRDTVRSFWRGDPGHVPVLAQALSGSRETFAASGRGIAASVNYVCSHDGFTLRDLVSYEAKHNERNGEGNRDGTTRNLSRNYGHEGETADAAIAAIRARQTRNLLATLFLSQGVPMLLAGDELARSQAGNNNAYCQDNELSWLDWQGVSPDPHLPDFVAAVSALRRDHAALRRTDYLSGREAPETGLRDVYWLAPSGAEMDVEDWQDNGRRALGIQLGNDAPDGKRLLVLVNAGEEQAAFALRSGPSAGPWAEIFATDRPAGLVGDAVARTVGAGGTVTLPPRSLVLFGHVG